MYWRCCRRARKGTKMVSKRPVFITVNTVSGQNDPSPSSIHNYYNTQRRREIKSTGRVTKVQSGAARWAAPVNEAPLSLSSATRRPRSPHKTALRLLFILSGLIICVFPSHIEISLTLPSLLYLKACPSMRTIKVGRRVYATILTATSLPPYVCLICTAVSIKVDEQRLQCTSIHLSAHYAYTKENNLIHGFGREGTEFTLTDKVREVNF